MLVRRAQNGQFVPRTGFGKKKDSPSTLAVQKRWKRCEFLWETAKKMLISAGAFPNLDSGSVSD